MENGSRAERGATHFAKPIAAKALKRDVAARLRWARRRALRPEVAIAALVCGKGAAEQALEFPYGSVLLGEIEVAACDGRRGLDDEEIFLRSDRERHAGVRAIVLVVVPVVVGRGSGPADLRVAQQLKNGDDAVE